MDETKLLTRMEEMEKKLDMVLDYVNQQRLKSEVVEDLISDLSIIGKEVYNTSVAELEKESVEIDPDQVIALVINMLKNIGNFNRMLALMNTMTDMKNIPSYSLWKALREMNSPEMKTALGFMITSVKKLSQINNMEN